MIDCPANLLIMKEKTKILICFPSMHNIDTLVRFEHDRITLSVNGRFDITVEQFENFDRDDARNRMAERTLKDKFDYLFMVDDDMILPDNCLNDLYDSRPSHGIIGGLYCSWGKTHAQHCYDYIPNKDKFSERFKQNRVEPNTGIHYRDMVGAGCCLIDSQVFEIIDKPWFSFQYQGNDRLGEDNSFFEKCWRSANIPVLINSDVVCIHVGKFGVRPSGKDTIEVVNLA